MDLTDPVTVGLIATAVVSSVLVRREGVPQLKADKRKGPKPYRERAKKQRGDHTRSQMAYMLETADHLRANTRFGKLFRPVYRIPASMYEDVYRWMDQNRLPLGFQKRDYDCCGEAAIPLKLKVLSGYFMLSTGLSPKGMAHMIGCDEETMRVFFMKFVRAIASLAPKWIKLPTTHEEVRITNTQLTYDGACSFTSPQVQSHVATYEDEGLPGCMGSIDCTHIGWTRSRDSVRSWYIGKEGVPTVSFQVRLPFVLGSLRRTALLTPVRLL